MPTTLITGASRGIGLATARHLRAEGHEIVILSRTPPPAHLEATHVAVDLGDAETTASAMAEVTRRFSIDHVVNNAGLPWPDRTGETTLEGFDAVIGVNLRAALVVTQACLPAMRAQGYGRIVNISSRAALGLVHRNSYAAAKAGLIGLSRTWALELGRDGITVNVVAPGPVETELFRENNATPEARERVRRRIEAIPVGRIGQPEDIAHAIAFFLAPGAGFVTGQTLFVCGGASVGATSS